jgi:hypothetical protein
MTSIQVWFTFFKISVQKMPVNRYQFIVPNTTLGKLLNGMNSKSASYKLLNLQKHGIGT